MEAGGDDTIVVLTGGMVLDSDLRVVTSAVSTGGVEDRRPTTDRP